MTTTKYKGIIPAFYVSYKKDGSICKDTTIALAKYFAKKGVTGLYVGGSSGECIYQGVEERKKQLEYVVEAVKGELTIIAHVACNNTKDSCELASHAQSLGVDAIASIPPIYFKLPEDDIINYWNAISNSAKDTDFIIYNIPQLAGTALSVPMLKKMMENKNVIGVKNSSMPVYDIELFKAQLKDDGIVFNGPDEQILAGLSAGAEGGIGGTYGAMPELFIKIYDLFLAGDIKTARAIQYDINEIIAKLCSGDGCMYAIIKEVIKKREGIDLGGVRLPFRNASNKDDKLINECVNMIDAAIKKYI